MRTGIIGMYNLVLVFALSGRNNLMLWMTGWSFSTLNLFHRWAARISILQAVVHSIVYIQFQYANGKFFPVILKADDMLTMRQAFGKPSGVVGALTELYYQMGVMVNTSNNLHVWPSALTFLVHIGVDMHRSTNGTPAAEKMVRDIFDPTHYHRDPCSCGILVVSLLPATTTTSTQGP